MKEFNPLVSIIIPVYNGENYVKEAIESALAQTYKNIEIIVVNDGSKDNTEKICKSYKNKIRYIKKENGGVSSALNLAIKNMKGEYFSWLSHDDLYFPNKVEAQINFLKSQKNKEVILYSDYAIINERGELTALCKKDHKELQKKPLYSLLTGAVNGITMLIPKVCFEKVGNFNEKLRCTQDYDLWFKFIQKYQFIHMEQPLSCTRIHSGQDSQVNPNVIREGNELWIMMIRETAKNHLVSLEASKYEFYQKILGQLKETQYDKAIAYLKEQISQINRKVNEIIKNEEYKVSVIIPFYNRERITLKAIESVKRQSYRNYEIILINDSSTENIQKIVKEAKNNDKIKLFHNKKNMGPSYSRNVGIEKATGDYIAMLDSDDQFNDLKIEKQLKNMLLHNSEASYTNYTVVKANKKTNINAYTPNVNGDNEFFYNCRVATPTIMFKKELLISNNIKYNERLKYCEDACFYLEILKITNFLHINDYLTDVYVSSTSSSQSKEKKIEGLKNILNYCNTDNYYKFIVNKERQNLISSIVLLHYTDDIVKVGMARKIYRKLPLDFRKKMKRIMGLQ